MIVSPQEPYKIVFSIFSHEYLGYLVEGYVAQLNARGEVSYKTQNISAKNMRDFEQGMDADDVELIKLTDAIQQDVVFKKFNVKKLSQEEFFLKIFDPEKGDKFLKDSILTYVENYKKQIFLKIKSKQLFVMGNDGIPTWKEINIVQEPAKAFFHFERLEDHTVYYPILKCGEEKLKFQFKNAVIINDLPAALLLEGKLYMFDQYADGKKLKPFLNKPNIIIPKKIEETYYQKFIVPLIAGFNVFAKGFDIVHENEDAVAILKLKEIKEAVNQNPGLFDNHNTTLINTDKLRLELNFKYGHMTFPYDAFSAPAYVKLRKNSHTWMFHKVKKNLSFEKKTLEDLKKLSLDFKNGFILGSKIEILEWIMEHNETLSKLGINIDKSSDDIENYFIGSAQISVNISEKNDWFDVDAIILFGEFRIPFRQLRKYILNNTKEFKLPNGQLAIIPSTWFTKYSELLGSIREEEDFNKLALDQIGLVKQLDKEGLAASILGRRLERLLNFEQIDEIDLPKKFKGDLRPYQKAGYDWLHFLKSYKLGGCLADDMGLGKTVTTLAFLQSIVEEKPEFPSLLLMPTSLIYNWVKEAKKFTPNLKVLVHFGPNRSKNCGIFNMYDLVISSYGVCRSDIDFLNSYTFNYVILDESQNIKNPGSAIFKAVMRLTAKNRLILTGTPLENSSMDLWSQMSFLNPGLLGTESEFRNKFTQNIDKKRDEDTLKTLAAKIKPFLLRRHKSQVAKDLPKKIESITYCKMSPEQEKLYDETKSYVRNMILNSGTTPKLLILQALSKLRQLANHPKMVDAAFEGESGKDSDVLHKLLEVTEQGSKVLVFSQFVKHLQLIVQELEKREIPFLYLDGSTKNRMELVEEFQNSDKNKIFLISLKAGGVGLNLTAAEYVFMLDPWWNPAIEAQAIDRAHRIGQTKTVFSYKFISQNTLEEKIVDLQNAKKELFNDLISTEENFFKSLSKEDMLSLID